MAQRYLPKWRPVVALDAMPELRNQVVIVTGASSGIGEAIVRRLVAGGARAACLARRIEKLDALRAEIDAGGGATLMVAGDVTVAADRERLVVETLARFGRIDALVNNAGYGQRGPLERVPIAAVRANFETNVFSLLALTQLVVPHLRVQGSGRVVNVGSVAGKIARPLTTVYDATKHAVEGLTDGLRGELKPFGVQVVLVRPGLISTEFGDTARAVSAETLADAGPYQRFQGGFQDRAQRLRKVAASPDVIARLVERALTAKCPATHYNGPTHAKVFLFLKWLLPVRMFDWFVRLKG